MLFRSTTQEMRAVLSFFLVSALIAISGCSQPRTYNSPAPDLQNSSIAQERLEKDASFRSQDSPLPEPERAQFQGLSYFPVDPALRFSIPLHRYDAPAPVRLATNTGEMRSGLRYGYFEFQVENRPCRLQVYRLEDSPDDGGTHLFIPFRDSTSGRETYEAGRYVDLKENTSGIYELDFNRAYSPFCAYNSHFSCPLTPGENTLKVPIRAGEKKYR